MGLQAYLLQLPAVGVAHLVDEIFLMLGELQVLGDHPGFVRFFLLFVLAVVVVIFFVDGEAAVG